MVFSIPPPPQDIINDNDEISAGYLLEVIADNLRLLIIGPILAGLLGLAYSYTITPMFTAKTMFIPPQLSHTKFEGLAWQSGVLVPLAGDGKNFKYSIDNYLAFMQSNGVSKKLIKKFKLEDHYSVQSVERALSVLKDNSKITVDKKSGLINIEVSDKDPQFAANLANGYVSALSQFLRELALEEAKSRQQSLEQQMVEATKFTYKNPSIREVIIQSISLEYKAAHFDQNKDSFFIQQIDVATAPEFRSKPIRSRIALTTVVISEFLLILFVFIRDAFQNYKRNHKTNM